MSDLRYQNSDLRHQQSDSDLRPQASDSDLRPQTSDLRHPIQNQALRSTLIAEHAVSIAALSCSLVGAIQRRDRDLASQVRRAVSSIALNAAEAHGNSGGNTRVRFESALGSLYEAKAGIQLAIAWGYISEAAAAEAVESMNCLGGRLFGLCRR